MNKQTKIEMQQNIPQLPKDVICSSDDFYVEIETKDGDLDYAFRKFVLFRQNGFEVDKYYSLTSAWDAMRKYQRNEHHRTEAESNLND